MPSFQYPQHLLHDVIEPQWFPGRKEETESTLTALEAAEEAYAQTLHKLVTEDAPTAGASIIGQRPPSSSSSNRRWHRASRSSSTPTGASATAEAQTPEASTPLAVPAPTVSSSQRFWNRAGSSRRSSAGAQTVTDEAS